MAEDTKRDWFDIAAKLFLPLVIFLVGQQYSCQKDASEKQQREFDRNMSLLRAMSSKDENEKLVAIGYITYLLKQKDFPEELLSGVVAVSTGNPSDPSVKQAQL